MILDTKKVLTGVDLQRNYMWELILPTISSANNLEVSALIQKVRFGDYSLTDLVTRKQGPFSSHFAGSFEIGTLDITLLSPISRIVTTYFQSWKDLIVDPSGYYFPKKSYAKTAYAYLYDTAGTQTESYSIHNIFPKSFPAYNLDYADGGLTKFDISFSIDYIKKL